ncbi:MAG: hypothetical protein PVI21_00685 [Candidatus Woesebacteria bacterium]|jgi:hypothetical protein
MPTFPTPEQLSQQQRAAVQADVEKLRAAVMEAFNRPGSDGSYYVYVEGYSDVAVGIVIKELEASAWSVSYESSPREGSALRIRPNPAASRGGGNATAWL